MKTLVKYMFVAACISLSISCKDFLPENIDVLKMGLDQDRFVTMKSMNLKVHYRIIGKGPVDMVFIPGWTNALTAFTKQFDYFRDKSQVHLHRPSGAWVKRRPRKYRIHHGTDGRCYL